MMNVAAHHCRYDKLQMSGNRRDALCGIDICMWGSLPFGRTINDCVSHCPRSIASMQQMEIGVPLINLSNWVTRVSLYSSLHT